MSLLRRFGRRGWTIFSLLGLGGSQLGLAALFSEGYEQGLLLNLGTGFLLFGVLYVIQANVLDRVNTVERETRESAGRLGRDVEQVRQEVKSTQARLDQIGSEARAILKEQHRADEQALNDFEENVTFATTLRLLERGYELRALSPEGVRVRVPNTEVWVRFVPMSPRVAAGANLAQLAARLADKEAVFVRVEDLGGRIEETILWTEGQPVTRLMVGVAKTLQRLGQYPGDERYDATKLLKSLKETLAIAVDSRTHHRGRSVDLGLVIEIPNRQWAITTDGLECIEHPYFIHKERLGEQWLPHMSTKPWVDIELFDAAFIIAGALHRGSYEDE